jgi:hypothetical protein
MYFIRPAQLVEPLSEEWFPRGCIRCYTSPYYYKLRLHILRKVQEAGAGCNNLSLNLVVVSFRWSWF